MGLQDKEPEELLPMEWAVCWLDFLVRYADGQASLAPHVWTLTHPDLRLQVAKAIIADDRELLREMTSDQAGESELWPAFESQAMSRLLALLPVRFSKPSAGRWTAFQVEPGRQLVVMSLEGRDMAFTVAERASGGWQVQSVQHGISEATRRLRALMAHSSN